MNGTWQGSGTWQTTGGTGGGGGWLAVAAVACVSAVLGALGWLLYSLRWHIAMFFLAVVFVALAIALYVAWDMHPSRQTRAPRAPREWVRPSVGAPRRSLPRRRAALDHPPIQGEVRVLERGDTPVYDRPRAHRRA
jgi:hypothetical protein